MSEDFYSKLETLQEDLFSAEKEFIQGSTLAGVGVGLNAGVLAASGITRYKYRDLIKEYEALEAKIRTGKFTDKDEVRYQAIKKKFRKAGMRNSIVGMAAGAGLGALAGNKLGKRYVEKQRGTLSVPISVPINTPKVGSK